MDLTPATLAQNLALFQSQALDSLFGSNAGASGIGEVFSALLSRQLGKNHADAGFNARLNTSQDANSRNLALFNPEAAYNLSTFINSRDVLYKAQYAELSQIKSGVSQLQLAGQGLGDIGADTPPAAVQALLQNFVDRYNRWRASFSADVRQGGLLQHVQAAEVSLNELEQSVSNRFFGAQDGVSGLRELGVGIDPNTHWATLDTQHLTATLGADPHGALSTLHAFSANFAQSAALLNSDNNFIPRQLDNLSRVIHYIDDHKAALAQEFGSGDPATPTGKVAQALAVYNRIYA
jgi:hypothetical protein